MSQTTTRLEPTTIRQILRTYDIHQTGRETTLTSGWSLQSPFTSQPEPLNWASDHRRIPPYREPGSSHRLSDRPSGRDAVESSFVLMMFSGVFVVSAVNKIWRNTAGRVNDRYMRYAVGGEW